ncbi:MULTISPECIES: hypothetical protein [Photorhabdus]|uniref:hypothetical protein n=1 Tax=Photorhabdus TaxID=29487 RepID=UPI0006978E91|nr:MULTISPECIES: hypothetical protein [Photorhabdus]
MSNSIKGGDAAKRYLKQLAKKIGEGKKLRFGFFKDATYPDGTSVAMVAISNEIGDPRRNRSPRPFFRNTINEHANEWGCSVTDDRGSYQGANSTIYSFFHFTGQCGINYS